MLRAIPITAAIWAMACSAAVGATFDSTPPIYSRTGTGPFHFAARSQGGSGENGWLAYQLPTETDWHRCQNPNPVSFALSNLADGTYTVHIADDINVGYWASQGQLYSGHTAGCNTTDPPATPTTGFTFYVDSTPPTADPPTVQVADKSVELAETAGDATTGVATYTWDTGDGAQTTGPATLRYTYLNYGTYTGSVTVADAAGNTTTRPFTVSLPAPTATPTPTTTQPAPQPKPSPRCAARKRAYKAANTQLAAARRAYSRHHTPRYRRRWRQALNRRNKQRRLLHASC